MSVAPAAPVAHADAAPAKGSKKKLIIIIIAAVLVLVLGGGGAAMLLLKKKPAEGEEDAGDGHSTAEAAEPAKTKAKNDPKHPPIFLPLDPFTVNLADKESERYAQIGITLEIDDAKTADELKVYMPAIRNNILMVLAHKTAAEILTREGKEKLARSILVAAVRPLGFEVAEELVEPEASAAEAAAKKKKKNKKAAAPALPVTAVHFSNFIIQ
jgi:flagellar FliL protein